MIFRLLGLLKSRSIVWVVFLVLVYLVLQLRTPSDQLRAPGPWRNWDVPTDPADYAAYVFAHSIKLPDEPKPDGFFKPGFLGFGRTSGEAYFKHLCETEAGEFIYKTVEGVEGIFQMRPRRHATTAELEDRYRLEDPYGYTAWEADGPSTIFVNPPWAKYRFFVSPIAPEKFRRIVGEFRIVTPLPHDGWFWRYEQPTGSGEILVYNDRVPGTRFSYTWRGIRRAHDRENGIAGGELIVLDALKNEVLAVRRGFAKTGRVRKSSTGIAWDIARVCPVQINGANKLPKSGDFSYWLLARVLIPRV